MTGTLNFSDYQTNVNSDLFVALGDRGGFDPKYQERLCDFSETQEDASPR